MSLERTFISTVCKLLEWVISASYWYLQTHVIVKVSNSRLIVWMISHIIPDVPVSKRVKHEKLSELLKERIAGERTVQTSSA